MIKLNSLLLFGCIIWGQDQEGDKYQEVLQHQKGHLPSEPLELMQTEDGGGACVTEVLFHCASSCWTPAPTPQVAHAHSPVSLTLPWCIQDSHGPFSEGSCTLGMAELFLSFLPHHPSPPVLLWVLSPGVTGPAGQRLPSEPEGSN